MTASTASAHTSLRAFQAEIDKVKNDATKARHEHEQRVATEQLAGHHGKKTAHADKAKAAAAQGKDVVKKPAVDVPTLVEDPAHLEPDESIESITAYQDILYIPISVEEDSEDDPLRSKLGQVLLQNHGEYLLSLGQHPVVADSPVSTSGEGDTVKQGANGSGRRIANREEFTKMLARLQANVKAVNAELSELYVSEDSATKGMYGCWMIRWMPKSVEDIVEVRVAVARVALFRHKHEVETGRTSSVGMEILGFSPKGEAVVPTGHAASVDLQHLTTAKREKMSWDEICSKSSKVVSFIDLAGHERYLKTTLFGLTGCSPDYVMLIVGGNAGLIGMSKVAYLARACSVMCKAHVALVSFQEHLGVALALHVPVIIDMTPAHVLEQTVKQLNKVLRSQGVRKIPVWVETQAQAVECARNMNDAKTCPVFMVSNVTGKNLPYLRTLLNCLKTSQGTDKAELSILEKFMLTHWHAIGMVILAASAPPPKAIRRFEAQMLILYHNSTIQPRYQAVYQAMCHVNSIRQTVRVVSIEHPTAVLRTGDRAKMIFEFLQQPEFVQEGARLIVRESRSKLLGVVTRLLD
ncbi:hypothetical protein QFC21_004633 [Naganishia friedmannii]|uniref:Uncharacterized protein n=1 Tax=Naganishia friedmannii TaxID=89922 RepID=A0ACC2VDX8_9TREE|nr:hypothetical protein QFC21_004633 [Naganishia friedmannii]